MLIDNEIRATLTNPGNASADTLRQLVEQYPAFSLPAVLLLKHHSAELPQDEIERLRLHAAVCTADRKALFDLASDESADFASIYPPAKSAEAITTESAIDMFFANYGMADRTETEMLERMIFNPVPDYAEQLAREEAATQPKPSDSDSLESRIDAFIRDHSSSSEHSEHSEISEDSEPSMPTLTLVDGSLLSESLAKIFIKQGRYERAYEIITNLSLNYPKKSIYFADQLRFLQKLIKIRQAQQAKS